MKNARKDFIIDENLRLLAKMLFDTIGESKGSSLQQKIERIRIAAQCDKDSEISKNADLMAFISKLSDEDLHYIAKSFNQFLNLINTTEQFNSMNKSEDAIIANPIHIAETIKKLQASGISNKEIIKTLETMFMDLVLTAHPTETNRRSLINNLNTTNSCLEILSNNNLQEYKKEETLRRLRQLIEQYWYTDEIRKAKPSPNEEAKWGNDVIETSLWKAVPAFIRELNKQIAPLLDGYQIAIDAKIIQYTAWMGGDRDGNPNVTAKVTRDVLLSNRRRAAKLFLQDIEILVKELSMHNATQEFREYIGDYEVNEPYRELMKTLRTKLKASIEYYDKKLDGLDIPFDENLIIYNDEQLWEPLIKTYQSLIDCNMKTIADDHLTDTLRRVKAFGVTLVKTDIRQESTVHTEALSEITKYLGLGDYSEWSETEKQAFLIRELSSKRPLIPANWEPSPQTKEVLDTCRVIAETPKGVIPVYLISMSQKASDVLAVHLLLKETYCPYNLPVAPLFETLADLEKAASIMKELFSIGWYRGIIENKQMVMIGYSDSAKDAGALAAGWAQYTAQEEIIKVCDDNGVRLTLFHGRGGTIGRGGGPAKTALFSQPPGSLQGGLRVTEQGEMIRFKFGQSDLAMNTFSLYVEAILEANLLPPPIPKKEWRDIMDKLRDSSCKIYQDVVRGNEDFIQYFYQATPEAELAKLPIGSRPAKRRSTPSLESLRAIPWIFGWSQNRLMLPAWLGAGEALQELINQGGMSMLETMYNEWPFFRTRISMLEMVYAKANLNVAEYYDEVLVEDKYKYLGIDLRNRMSNDIATILSISHDSSLMADLQNKKTAQYVAVRNSFTIPLNILQVELLKRCRQSEKENHELEQALMITISGIAAGMRNSG